VVLANENYLNPAQWVWYDYTNSEFPNELLKGDLVSVYGVIYEYVGDDRLDPENNLDPINLAAEHYATDTANWASLNYYDYTNSDTPNEWQRGHCSP